MSLVRSPSVSGCQTNRELCTAAKQEEKRLADPRRRRQYQQQGGKGNLAKEPEFKRRQQSTNALELRGLATIVVVPIT